MKAVPQISAVVLEQLRDMAASSAGFSVEAIPPHAINQMALSFLDRGWTAEELLRRGAEADPEVLKAFHRAISIGETYFFRQPEHFEFLISEVVPQYLACGGTCFRAWCAGCASGEEVYSVAALLQAVLPGGGRHRIEVLGTDLLEQNLQKARRGVYQPWSIRPSGGSWLHMVLEPVGTSTYRVRDSLRELVTFVQHDLRDPPPVEATGRFNLIFCRNVFVYFSPEATRTACHNLASALAPDGFIVFATMDVSGAPPGLTRVGPPHLQIFSRKKPAPPSAERSVEARPPPAPKARKLEPPPAAPAVPPRAPEVDERTVAEHLRALEQIERGELREAEEILGALCRSAPGYVPGLLERALLFGRNGQRAQGLKLVKEVLRRIESLPPDAVLRGPEPLPVRFYWSTAQAYLAQEGVP